MGRMNEISQMLDERVGMNSLATQLQKWDRSLGRTEALKTAYQYIKEWKENARND
tara:strand:- start:221 stop:385 length:165 start_codon:yes stop_codon:yes gene_type:complete